MAGQNTNNPEMFLGVGVERRVQLNELSDIGLICEMCNVGWILIREVT